MKGRLKELREGRGYRTQKRFVAHANKYGYKITGQRYGVIERGTRKPDIDEIVLICKAMEISADSWLFGAYAGVDMRVLTEEERAIVSELVKGLLGLRQ